MEEQLTTTALKAMGTLLSGFNGIIGYLHQIHTFYSLQSNPDLPFITHALQKLFHVFKLNFSPYFPVDFKFESISDTTTTTTTTSNSSNNSVHLKDDN